MQLPAEIWDMICSYFVVARDDMLTEDADREHRQTLIGIARTNRAMSDVARRYLHHTVNIVVRPSR